MEKMSKNKNVKELLEDFSKQYSEHLDTEIEIISTYMKNIRHLYKMRKKKIIL